MSTDAAGLGRSRAVGFVLPALVLVVLTRSGGLLPAAIFIKSP
ncbi:hypothetical protein AB0O34_16985 [Sphaerisporangium sp. NPDC088356]